jgi:Domain of unknown function (DUF929)
MSSNSRSNAARPHSRNSRSLLFAWGAVGLVVVIVVALAAVKVLSGNGPSQSSEQAVLPVPPQLIHDITTVPQSVFNTIGTGFPAEFAGTAPVVLVGRPPLTLLGKSPSVLYYGAEYCPFCAAERWSIAVDLSRFGTWTGLQMTASGLNDGDYSTLTFSKARFTSPYVTFAAIEACSNIMDPNVAGCSGYTHLQSPTKQERAVLDKYASNRFVPGNVQGIAFRYIDVDNKVLFSGSTYQPGILTGLTQMDIGGSLSDPSNPLTRSIVGTANYLSASICAGPGGMPVAVRAGKGVKSASSALRSIPATG